MRPDRAKNRNRSEHPRSGAFVPAALNIECANAGLLFFNWAPPNTVG
jgi:hypothetical protein